MNVESRTAVQWLKDLEEAASLLHEYMNSFDVSKEQQRARIGQSIVNLSEIQEYISESSIDR